MPDVFDLELTAPRAEKKLAPFIIGTPPPVWPRR